MGICCLSQEIQTGALYHLEGWNGRGEMGGSFKREGICIPMADLKYIYISPIYDILKKAKLRRQEKILW